MAQFCTKCGTPLAEGLRFCTGCGATSGEAPMAAASPEPPAAVAPVSAPAPTSPATVPKASSGSPVLKIVLIVLAIFAFFSVLVTGVGVYFYYTHVRPRVAQIEAQVRNAKVPTATPEAAPVPTAPIPAPATQGPTFANTGVPIYPGASPKENAGSVSAGNSQLSMEELSTDDSVEKVVAYYKDKLGPTALVNPNGATTLIEYGDAAGHMVMISIAADSATGKTKIAMNTVAASY